MITRQEHLDWCKKRALEYLNQGDLQQAVASMISDLTKHEETAKIREQMPFLFMLVMMDVVNNNYYGVKNWIEGFI